MSKPGSQFGLTITPTIGSPAWQVITVRPLSESPESSPSLAELISTVKALQQQVDELAGLVARWDGE